jgi:ech hydrogenase subunit D
MIGETEVHAIEDIEIPALLREVDSLRAADWRLIQILAIATAEGAELIYSFGSGLAMRSLRLRVGAASQVPSITALYPAAFLYENEIRDLFGVEIERISGDWLGKVYDVSKEKPFAKATVRAMSSEEPALSAVPSATITSAPGNNASKGGEK